MADQADPPNVGNETLVEISSRPEFAPAYRNPDGGDTFETLDECHNAVLGRSVRDHIIQLSQAFRCEHVTPLLLKILAISGGNDWRASDDNAYAIQAGDFAAAGVQVPQYFWHLNGDNLNQGSGAADQRIIQHASNGSRAYTYVRAEGRPGAGLGDDVIGMRTFRSAVGFSNPYLASLSTATSYAGSITLRVPEWPQANERIVLMAIKERLIDDETGDTSRMAFEFGLGPGVADPPGDSNQAYALYLRWITGDNTEEFLINQIQDEFEAFQGVGITPGYEWTLGFHVYDPGGGTVVDFYVNGQFKFQDTNVIVGGLDPGSATSIRLLVGAGNDGKQFAGGPIRNVMLHTAGLDPVVVAPLMQFLYQRGAGYIT